MENNNSSLNKLFLEILETESKVIEKRKEKSLNQTKLKAKQQELFEKILQDNEINKQIEETNSKLIEVKLTLKDKELELERKRNSEHYLDKCNKENYSIKQNQRSEVKEKLKKLLSDVTNFGSQYKYQDLYKRIELRETNMKRINELEKSILDFDSLPTSLSANSYRNESNTKQFYEPPTTMDDLMDLNLMTDIFDDDEDLSFTNFES